MPSVNKPSKTVRVVPVVTLRIGEPPKTALIPPGQACDISEEEATDLTARGFLGGEVQPETAAPSIAVEDDEANLASTTEATDRIDAIVDTIDDLSPEDFGKDKKPNVRAIEKILGEDISADERDIAWGKYQSLLAGD